MGFWARKKAAADASAGRFESVLLPHLGAAYNLARWLMKNDQDAEDMVQDACLRALEGFGSFRGEHFRAWFLRIVRNVCYSRLKSAASHGPHLPFDEDAWDCPGDSPDPAAVLLQRFDAERLRRAVDDLPVEYREVFLLREVEEMSYREIAGIVDVPQGTVMSRLSRARRRLETALISGGEDTVREVRP